MRQDPQYDHPINRWKFEPEYQQKIKARIHLVLGSQQARRWGFCYEVIP